RPPRGRGGDLAGERAGAIDPGAGDRPGAQRSRPQATAAVGGARAPGSARPAGPPRAARRHPRRTRAPLALRLGRAPMRFRFATGVKAAAPGPERASFPLTPAKTPSENPASVSRAPLDRARNHRSGGVGPPLDPRFARSSVGKERTTYEP